MQERVPHHRDGFGRDVPFSDREALLVARSRVLDRALPVAGDRADRPAAAGDARRGADPQDRAPEQARLPRHQHRHLRADQQAGRLPARLGGRGREWRRLRAGERARAPRPQAVAAARGRLRGRGRRRHRVVDQKRQRDDQRTERNAVEVDIGNIHHGDFR